MSLTDVCSFSGSDATRADCRRWTEGGFKNKPVYATSRTYKPVYSTSCPYMIINNFMFDIQVAEDLMEQLGVSKETLVTGAYMDLILEGRKET